MKSKKLSAILASVFAAAMLLSACGGNAQPSAAPEASKAPEASEAPAPEAEKPEGEAAESPAPEAQASEGEVIELTLATWSPIPRTAEKMVAAFEAENPGIKIKYTNYNYNPEYLAALAAGAASDNLPDIIGLQPGSLTQQYRDYLIPLDTHAKGAWGDGWESKFSKIAADQIRLGNPAGDNGAYILPIESQVIYIVYNKAMFDELKIAKPTTYEELVAASKALTAAGKAPFWLGGADGWQHVNMFMMLASQVDTTLVDKAQRGEIKWTDPGLVRAVTNYKKMFDDGVFQVGALSNTAYPQGVNALTSGGAGMVALGSWWYQEFSADDPPQTVKDWVFDGFYLPAVESDLKPSAPIGGIDFGYGITKKCKNPEAAWKALQSFSSGAGIQACVDDLNNLAAFKGIVPKGEVPANIIEQTGAYAKDLDIAMNQRIGEPTIESALQNAMAGVAAGELTPEKAMESVQAAQDALPK